MKIPFAPMLLRYLRFFAGLVRSRMVVFIGITLVAISTEGLGIALLLPLLAGGTDTKGNPISAFVLRFVGAVGLSPDVHGVLVALVVVAVAKGALTFIATSYQYYLSSKITQDLRRMLLAGFARVDYRFILSTTNTRLANVITLDTINAANAFLYFARIFPHLLTVLGFMAIVASVDWRLTVGVLLAGAAISPVLRVFPRFAKRYSQRGNDEAVSFNSILFQSLPAYKYLKATDGFTALAPRFESRIRRITVLGYKIGATTAAASAIPQPIVAAILVAIMLWLLRTGGPGALSTGFVLLIYLYRTMNELFSLQAEWQQFAAFAPAVDNVMTLLGEFDAQREPAGGAAPQLREAIELVDVSFRYRDAAVLDGISLRIPRNSTVAFVGESGSGKTTLVDLISGVLRPESGKILVDGVDLQSLDRMAWRRGIGFVPQEPMLFDDTVAQNICFYSCDPSDPACMRRIEEAARRALCDHFVEERPERYQSRVGERGANVSGGQRQRLAIARELFKDPRVLILDEATSALDTESENYVRQSIDALRGSVTVLVIAHRLSTIRGADKVFVLSKGRIVEEGSFEELLQRKDSRLSELARLQAL